MSEPEPVVSRAGSLFFERARVQCHGLSSGSSDGHDRCSANAHHSARGVHCPEHLLPDSLTASGQFLYVGNRGHHSLAEFAVDAATGQLTALGQVAAEAVPSAFGLDPTGNSSLLPVRRRAGWRRIASRTRRGADPSNDVCRGPTAHGGTGHPGGQLGPAVWPLGRLCARGAAGRHDTCVLR